MTALIVTGCGSPVRIAPPIPQAVPPAGAASKWDLLYVSNGSGVVTVYRYWQHTLHQVLTGFQNPKGECVDAAGNVYITDAGLAKIFEYPHGGTKPVKLLSDPGYLPYGCSIDRHSGDLAVANYSTRGEGAGGIAIYRHATGKPLLYGPLKYASNPISCSYDGGGNLFVGSLYEQSGYKYASFVYLPKHSVSFIHVIVPYIGSSGPISLLSGVQWDGKYWAILFEGYILQYSIDSHGNATFQGQTALAGNSYSPGEFWIVNSKGSGQGTRVVTVQQYHYSRGQNVVYFWDYPAGGNSIGSITGYLNEPYGVTVSFAPN
jgi:hypothetical protein